MWIYDKTAEAADILLAIALDKKQHQHHPVAADKAVDEDGDDDSGNDSDDEQPECDEHDRSSTTAQPEDHSEDDKLRQKFLDRFAELLARKAASHQRPLYVSCTGLLENAQEEASYHDEASTTSASVISIWVARNCRTFDREDEEFFGQMQEFTRGLRSSESPKTIKAKYSKANKLSSMSI